MNILLVEDDDIDVLIFKRALKKAGNKCVVVRAKDGIEALDILLREHQHGTMQEPYVILLDINMPRMNGHEFMKALRENEDISHSRVVIVTTSENPKDIRLAYEKHVSGYVVKPKGASEMSEVIRSLQEYWDICKNPAFKSAPPTS